MLINLLKACIISTHGFINLNLKGLLYISSISLHVKWLLYISSISSQIVILENTHVNISTDGCYALHYFDMFEVELENKVHYNLTPEI